MAAVGDLSYDGDKLTIARSDGLYTYSYTENIQLMLYNQSKSMVGDGSGSDSGESKAGDDTIAQNKIDDSIMNMVLPESGASYFLIATTYSISGRGAVDIYDSSNKLVVFHLLLSPGHQALRSIGITTTLKAIMDGNTHGGLSSAIVVMSGGSIVTMMEKVTSDKFSLLVEIYSWHLQIHRTKRTVQKLCRTFVSHCHKNRRVKRMLLELTLEEWNNAKRLKDIDMETNMRNEAMAMLSDPNSANELGNYEALVIVQQQDFTEGMVMLYVKLQMVSSSIEAHAEDVTKLVVKCLQCVNLTLNFLLMSWVTCKDGSWQNCIGQ